MTRPIDHARAARTAAAIGAQLGMGPGRDVQLPPDEDLGELARGYLELARAVDRPPIFVAASASEEYAQAKGLRIEEARRELTRLLLDGRPTQADPSEWRVRHADLTARVSYEDGLAIITRVHVADRRGRRG